MYIGFSSPQLIRRRDHRLPQPRRAAAARHRDGVASAEILGGQTFAMRVWLDPLKMAARGVTAAEVADAIRANNFQSAPGPGQGLFHRHQRHRRHRPDASRRSSADGGQGRRAARWCGCSDIAHHRTRRPEHQLLGHDERPGGRVHRRAADADRQSARPSSRACASCSPTIERGLPPTVKMEHRLRLRPSSSKPRSTR